MSAAFIVVAMVAAVNAARVRLAIPADVSAVRRLGPVAGGGVLVLAVAAAGVAVAGSLLDALDVAPESFEIAAGVVLVLMAARDLLFSGPVDEPALPGWGAALVPVAFPLLLNPALIALVIALGALEPAGTTIGALAIALLIAVAATLVPGSGTAERLLRASVRLHGIALAAVAVQLIVEGVRDV